MKALVLSKQADAAERPLSFSEVPVPEPGPGEVLLKVETCGVCRTDLHVVEGDLQLRKRPVIPGHQIIGVVEGVGTGVNKVTRGTRLGGAWLNSTCGICRFCIRGRENLCDSPEFTGWTRDGGYAQYAVVPFGFAYPIPDGIEPVNAAPLMCAGIIGYRALKISGIEDWREARLGIYGFGAAGHVAIQLARHRGAEVYVATRDKRKHQALAEELGAEWVGDTYETPPEKLDAAIVFAPAGEIVPAALKALEKGGTLVLGGIHMSPIPEFKYRLIYGERIIKSVMNNTRADGEEFLREAVEARIETSVRVYSFEEANQALIDLKTDAVRGAAVLEVSS
ncbi:MAG: zinc-binding alcohol dehydrogenase family protein [Acidobacteria bacterium]|nr:MAG: zinc-binding alcohol dehydrogenase family protein [Acidobacteriota bacterium]REK04173.1 MAG: zinc-binding alcohol dehydrogenase family protein [Acidobacteriota bacterium]REK15335.1 MAG: zinc-binding alcohol dehydrogenase family protein [Acidobacteriota bacterium]REK46425.1 MAG: zinc-binding alcohol dehydrogenase family protein [Acidobacteriota bacterium]